MNWFFSVGSSWKKPESALAGSMLASKRSRTRAHRWKHVNGPSPRGVLLYEHQPWLWSHPSVPSRKRELPFRHPSNSSLVYRTRAEMMEALPRWSPHAPLPGRPVTHARARSPAHDVWWKSKVVTFRFKASNVAMRNHGPNHGRVMVRLTHCLNGRVATLTSKRGKLSAYPESSFRQHM